MTFYLTQYIQNITISTCNQYKTVLTRYFTFFHWSLASTPMPLSFLHMCQLILFHSHPGVPQSFHLVLYPFDK